MHVAGQQRIDPRQLVGDADQLDFVEIGRALAPVVFVAHDDCAYAGFELAQLERSAAVACREIRRAVLDDQEMRRGEDLGQVCVRADERDLQVMGTEHLYRGDLLCHGLHLGRGRRQLVAQQRV